MAKSVFRAHAIPAQAGSVATSTVEERLAFLKRVYAWMTAALVVAALGGAIAIDTGAALWLLQGGFVLNLLVVFAWMGLAYVARAVRHKPVVNILAYAGYALFTGFVFSDILLVAMLFAQAVGHGSMYFIYQALITTVAVFGGLTFYTMVTKRDFSFLRGFLVAGVIGLIVVGILNYFLQSSVLGMVMSLFGVLIFSGYVLYDTQKILKTYPNREHVAASLELFVDFVLLFIYILNLILRIAAAGRD